MTNQTKILFFTIGFLAGIIFSANFLLNTNWLLIIPMVFLLPIGLYFVKGKLFLILIFILGLFLGLARYEYFAYKNPKNELSSLELTKHQVVGRVNGDVYRDQFGNNNFILSEISINGKRYNATIKVKTFNGAIKEGQKVLVLGKVKPARGKSEEQISFAKVEVINSNQPILVKIKSIFVSGIKRSLPEPASSFLIGILIGARSTLPKTLQDYLIITGLAHIVAVSGYNLTIITGFLDRILKGKWKWGSLVLSLWLMLAFVIITGASASIVRAAVMSGIFIIVRFYGKKISILSVLCLTAIITCLFNPSYIIEDLGWQLSFLSLTGIVIFSPKIENFLPKKLPFALKEIITVSLAAQIATFPFIAYKFGQISLAAPLANVLIMPIIPLLMLFGLLAGIIGSIFSASLASTIFYPLSKLIDLLIDLIRYLASFKLSSVKISNPKLYSVILVYTILVGLALLKTKKFAKTIEKNK